MSERLSDILDRAAARNPDGIALTFLSSTDGEQNISARQLKNDASRVAWGLRDAGVRPGELVPLVFDHGYEVLAAFWGCLYAGAIPAILPFVSPEALKGPIPEQVRRLIRYAEPSVIVAPSSYAAFLLEGLGDSAVRIIAPQEPTPGEANRPEGRLSDSEHDGPSYIQFSSGTTGRPKGVCLTDAALLEYFRVAVKEIEITADDVAVGWLPLYHDMGLVNQVLQPMAGGYRSVFINPADWLREPWRLFQAISRYRGSVNWMPNFGFRYCLRRVSDAQLEGVDLSTWRLAGNGSEPALLEDIEAFVERFGRYGLPANAVCIGYGMAEHVAGLTWTPVDKAPVVDWVSADSLAAGHAAAVQPQSVGSRAIVSCGPPLESVEVRIVDQEGGELPERWVGELVARGPIVFQSYYRQPEETARALRGGWFHTGDLGYLAGGELFICGRTKDLIIVAGRNIHPLQIEEIAEAVMGGQGRFAAAFGITNPSLGTEMIVVICEMRKLPDEPERIRMQQELRERARHALAVFVADVVFVGPGWIIRTTSGKINRGANRDKYASQLKAG